MKQEELMKRMEVLIREEHKNIGGIVVQKAGNICYEKYFKEFTKDNPFHIFSVTKSIISILNFLSEYLEKKSIIFLASLTTSLPIPSPSINRIFLLDASDIIKIFT